MYIKGNYTIYTKGSLQCNQTNKNFYTPSTYEQINNEVLDSNLKLNTILRSK